MTDDPGRGCHDVGGLPAGSIERAEHAHAPWEKRVDALMVLLAKPERRLVTVDELRRGIEQLGARAYDEMSYYERWIASIAGALLAKGVITADELGRRMAEVEARADCGRTYPSNVRITELERVLGPLRPQSEVAQWLRRERDRAGLTQGELANRAKVSPVTISNTERGDTAPQRGTIAKLANALGVPAPGDGESAG